MLKTKLILQITLQQASELRAMAQVRGQSVAAIVRIALGEWIGRNRQADFPAANPVPQPPAPDPGQADTEDNPF